MTTTFEIGDLTLHRIVEKTEAFCTVGWMFPDLTPEQLADCRSWMRPVSLTQDDELIMCFQSYVLRTPHHTILIDSCIGNHKRLPQFPTWHMRATDNYMRSLASHGLTVEDIDYVMCTHLHSDHVGWNTRLEDGRWVPTFPNARYLFTKKEYDYWADVNARESRDWFVDSVLPVMEANRVDLVGNTHELGDYVRFQPAPGHTPDHVVIRVGRNRDDAVIVGDAVHSPLQIRYPEISPGDEFDKVQSAASRRKLLSQYCDTNTHFCTMHFPSPSVGHIRRQGEGFKCEMTRD